MITPGCAAAVAQEAAAAWIQPQLLQQIALLLTSQADASLPAVAGESSGSSSSSRGYGQCHPVLLIPPAAAALSALAAALGFLRSYWVTLPGATAGQLHLQLLEQLHGCGLVGGREAVGGEVASATAAASANGGGSWAQGQSSSSLIDVLLRLATAAPAAGDETAVAAAVTAADGEGGAAAAGAPAASARQGGGLHQTLGHAFISHCEDLLTGGAPVGVEQTTSPHHHHHQQQQQQLILSLSSCSSGRESVFPMLCRRSLSTAAAGVLGNLHQLLKVLAPAAASAASDQSTAAAGSDQPAASIPAAADDDDDESSSSSRRALCIFDTRGIVHTLSLLLVEWARVYVTPTVLQPWDLVWLQSFQPALRLLLLLGPGALEELQQEADAKVAAAGHEVAAGREAAAAAAAGEGAERAAAAAAAGAGGRAEGKAATAAPAAATSRAAGQNASGVGPVAAEHGGAVASPVWLQQEQVLLLDALLGVLSVSAPGQEGDALSALQLMLHPSLMVGLRRAAQHALQNLAAAAAQQSAEANAADAGASGGRQSAVSTATQASAGIAVPAPPASVQAAAADLLAAGGGDTSPALSNTTTTTSSSSSSCSPECAVAIAAAGYRGSAAAAGKPLSSAPFPPPTTLPTSDTIARALLGGYAAAWLSLVNEKLLQPPTAEPAVAEAAGTATATAAPQLVKPWVGECQGSRLPLPHHWYLAEILAVPGSIGESAAVAGEQAAETAAARAGAKGGDGREQVPHTSAAAKLAASAAMPTGAAAGVAGDHAGPITCIHPAAAVLVLCLGLQEVQSQAWGAIRPATRLTSLLQLMMLQNVWELWPEGAQTLISAQQQQQRGAGERNKGGGGAGVGKRGSSKSGGEAVAAAVSEAAALRDAVARWGAGELTLGVWRGLKGGSSSSGDSSRSSSRSNATGSESGALQPPPASAAAGGRGFGLWPSPLLIDRLVSEFAETSFGDPLLGCQLALLWLPVVEPQVQRALWESLAQQAALHLMPKAEDCIGRVEGYLRRGSRWGLQGEGGGEDRGFDVQLVGIMARSLARGELGKARRMGSLAAALAVEGVAALGLDQREWAQEIMERGGGRVVGCMAGKVMGEGRRYEGEGRKNLDGEAMAVNVIRGLVRSGDVGLVKELLGVAEKRGVERGEAERALVQCCHGDSQLMDVVREAVGSAS